MQEGSNIGIPIRVRSHELRQLHEMLPQAVASLEQAEKDEKAAEVEGIYEDYVNIKHEPVDDPAWATDISMEAEEWGTVMMAISRVRQAEGVHRVWWIQKKFVERLRERQEQLE